MKTEITIDTGTDELLCAIRERVAVITLNRPTVRNALSDDLTPALRAMIKSCGENPEVGALLITSRRVTGLMVRDGAPDSANALPGKRLLTMRSEILNWVAKMRGSP